MGGGREGALYANRDANDNLYVRCLCFSGGRWRWDYGWLGIGWDGGDPAALRAS